MALFASGRGQGTHGSVRRASIQHASLARRFDRFSNKKNGSNRDKTLHSLADVLWMVRSNIAHGEKTVVGPDPLRNERNRQVAKITLPVLDVLLDEILGNPSCTLIAYGTLAPGGVNAGLLDHLDGTWTTVEVSGASWEGEDGLPRFRWEPSSGTTVVAALLTSHDLPDNWARLDQFEGSSYRRILVRHMAGQGFGIGNCYEYHDD